MVRQPRASSTSARSAGRPACTSTASSPAPTAATTTRSRSTSPACSTRPVPTSCSSASTTRSAPPASRSASRSRARRTGSTTRPRAGSGRPVWLEPVPRDHVTALDLVPDLAHSRLLVTASTTAGGRPGAVVAQALAGQPASSRARAGRPGGTFSLRINDPARVVAVRPLPLRAALRAASSHGATCSTTSRATSGCARSRSAASAASPGSCSTAASCSRPARSTRATGQTACTRRRPTPRSASTSSRPSSLGYDMLREHQKVAARPLVLLGRRLGILVWQDMPRHAPGNRRADRPPPRAEFRRELARDRRAASLGPLDRHVDPVQRGLGPVRPQRASTHEIKSLDRSALVDSDSGSANCCNAIEAREHRHPRHAPVLRPVRGLGRPTAPR